MSLTRKLFVAHPRQQKVRLALTALAMIAAVGVVLWVVSAYETIASKFDEQTADFVGNYSVFVAPKSIEDGLSAELIASLAEAPAVQAANPVAQFRMMFRRVGEPRASPTVANAPPAGPPGRGMGRMGPTIVGTTSSEPRYPLADGRWLNADSDDEAVVSSGVAEALSLKPGDRIEFRTKQEEVLGLTVVGVVEQVQEVESAMTRTRGGAPGGVNRGPASMAAYVPLHLVEQLTGVPARMNLMELRLQPKASGEELASLVSLATPPAELIRPEDIRVKLSSGFEAQGARKQAYFVAALSILASAFIIFTTLSMGVNERSRQLAVLRAVGLRRSQVASLVLVEAFVLAMIGWVGGLAGGWVLLKMLASANQELFPKGVTFGGMSLVLTGACSLIGSLLASIFPIWKATRISPLEAMVPLQTARRTSGWYAAVALVSVLLVIVNPLLVFLPNLPETVRFALILLIGAPASVLGFVLMAPLIVLVVERVFSPPVASLLRLQTNLVKTQLSANMWRSAGIAASLMLGLGLYTATQVWGWSMLGGFLPGRWTPGTIVKFNPGLPDAAIEKVRQTPGVAGTCLPIAVEQTKLVGDPLKSGERDSAVRQDNVALIGIDVDQAFTGDSPAFDLKFVQGDRDEALAKLRHGRFCLVPDTFLTYAGLNVGDRIGLIPPKKKDQPVEYTIIGVLSMPGSNWLTKTSGIRRNSVRTAGLVFAPRAQVREDFDLPLNEFFWLNAEPGVTAEQLQASLQPLAPPARRGPRGGPDGQAARGTTGGPGSRAGGPPGSPPGGGRGGPPGSGRRPGGGADEPLQVTMISDVRDGLVSRGGDAVKAMGWLPLITLLVVSLGIVNTIAASVRARRWEFGILRAVGLRRFALTRLVLSEALMIGFVASILSLTFGVLTGWTCLGLIRYVSNPWFEGVSTPLVIPWSALGYGYGLTFLLCIVAALWPAISTGRAEPMGLLQAGRSAT